MKLSTKTLLSLLRAISSPGEYRPVADEQRVRRLLQRHDRKAELRAAVLNMPAAEFRFAERRHMLDIVLKRHGFRSVEEFYRALCGKVKAELRQRGWSSAKIDTSLLRHSHLG